MNSVLPESASIVDLAAALRTGELTPVKLAELFLVRIEGRWTPHALVYCLDGGSRAGRSARGRGAIARGAGSWTASRHPLCRERLFSTSKVSRPRRVRAFWRTTWQSAIPPPVRKLATAGMTLLGKTHTVQFAFGGAWINHDQGTPHNPWSSTPMAPGGSSSGSAVAVGAGLTPVALGSDTGGSVRVPAALCGTIGLKTTVGRISRAGVYPLSWTFDSVGPLTRYVEDAAMVYQALRGMDPCDDTTTVARAS